MNVTFFFDLKKYKILLHFFSIYRQLDALSIHGKASRILLKFYISKAQFPLLRFYSLRKVFPMLVIAKPTFK